MQKLDSIAILAIDDDPDDIAILQHHLANMPGVQAEVRAFADPAEGIAECRERAPDVVLLDYMLGQRSGLDVFREMSALGIDIPVILVTDHGDEETAVEALHSGVSDYLPKDVASPKSLRRSILNSIERARLRCSLREHGEELERTVKRLHARNEEIQSFYHSLSHELKTPLTAVREFISIVLDGLQGPLTGDQRESLQIAKSACNQMTSCINDIIDVTRIETGKLALNPSYQPVVPVLRQAVAQSLGRATEKGIALDWSVHGEDCEATFDERRILQVLTNLIDNGIKFTEPGGAVSVSARRSAEDPRFVTIVVRDDGRGIDLDQHERIFDRLYQSKDEDAATLGGLGLGLHICRELVRSHGGRIEVESKKTQGSAFTCWLPVKPEETEQRETV